MGLKNHRYICNYTKLIREILKDISNDIYCFAPGNESLSNHCKTLQQALDDTHKIKSSIQILYNIFASNYAAKAIGIIQKANLVFPGLLELFGKSQFLGEKESISLSASAEPDDYL